MTISDSFLLLSNLSLVIYVILLAAVWFWAFRARISEDVRSRYAAKLLRVSQIPFTYHWRQSVRAEDLPKFEEARARNLAFVALLWCLPFLVASYLYVHKVIENSACYEQLANILYRP